MTSNFIIKPKLIVVVLTAILAAQINAQQVSNIKSTWLGNSNANSTTFMPQGIEGMYVSPDGTVYTNVGWEEGGGQYTEVKNGVVKHGDGSFGYGRYGGFEVAANSTYVYFAGELSDEAGAPTGKDWTGISRRYKSNIKFCATFEGAKGTSYNCFLVMYEGIGEATPRPTGLYATETELFAAFHESNLVKVYDANTMVFKRQFTVTKPCQMFMDNESMLWIAIGKNTNKIERYDINGVKQSQSITLANGSFVGDFCIDNTNRILIGDIGQREQILIYTNITSNPAQTSTFGTLNGMYSGTPGQMAPLKFNQIHGIGTDTVGNIYVCSTQWGTGGEGTILESYNLSTSALNWSKYCVLFVDALGIDAATDGQDAYGKCEHFTIDYSKPEGQNSTLTGFTINKYKYPADPRLHSELASVAVRNFGGKKFLAMSSMNGGLDAIFRFNTATDGEVAIPCVVFGWEADTLYPGSPSTPWMWRDLNGNGQPNTGEYVATNGHIAPDGGYGTTMDENGNLWAAIGNTINQFKCLGVDSNGVPIYDGTYTAIPKPAPFISVRRVQYNTVLDRMYLGGTTINYPVVAPWRAMGRAIHRYDNWSTGNRTDQSELVVPYEVATNAETVSFDVEGDYIFTIVDAASSHTMKRGEITVFNALNNAMLGYIRSPYAEIGYPDIAQCIDVFKRSNGEYVIIMEDDGRLKNIMYRWCPTGECILSDIAITLSEPNPSTTYLNYNSISITANVETDTSVISKVEFFVNDSLIGFATTKPYTFIWNKPKLGKNIIYAKATSINNIKVTSSLMLVNVSDGIPKAKLIISKSTYSTNDVIDLKVDASDADGTIDSVLFFVNDSLLFTDKNLPWEYNWSDFKSGNKMFQAKAYDNIGKIGLTDIIFVSVSDSTKIDNNDKGWVWNNFVYDPCSSCHLSSAHSTNTIGAWGEFTFTGTGIEAFCETWDGGGTVEIFIDGVSKGLFSQKIQPYGGAQKFAAITNLPNTKHVLKFVATTTYWVGIDYIKVLSSESSANKIRFVAEFKSVPVKLPTNSADWKHFANNDHKVYGQKINSISDYSVIGNGNAIIANTITRKMSWTEGTPVDNSLFNTQRVNISGVGNGFSLKVAANNDIDTLNIYVGGKNAKGILIAHLSNKAAPDLIHSINATTENWDLNYSIIYNAQQNGQYLEIKWIQASGNGSINLQAASLFGKNELKPIIPDSVDNILSHSNSNQINVFPNPTSQVLNINNLNSNAQISIYTIDGKLINKFSTQNKNNMVNVASFNKGLYILHLQFSNNMHVTKFEVK